MVKYVGIGISFGMTFTPDAEKPHRMMGRDVGYELRV
jgi:hypothetical protein